MDKLLVVILKKTWIIPIPILDPLRSLLPEIYRPRGGLPDAARETRISAGLFWEETFVELGMYKLIREVLIGD